MHPEPNFQTTSSIRLSHGLVGCWMISKTWLRATSLSVSTAVFVLVFLGCFLMCPVGLELPFVVVSTDSKLNCPTRPKISSSVQSVQSQLCHFASAATGCFVDIKEVFLFASPCLPLSVQAVAVVSHYLLFLLLVVVPDPSGLQRPVTKVSTNQHQTWLEKPRRPAPALT